MIYESKLTASEVSKVLDVLVECNIHQLWHERVLNGVVCDINSGFYTIEEAVYKFIDECIPDTYKTGYKPKSEAVEVTEVTKDPIDVIDPIDNIDTNREKEIIKAKAKAKADERKAKVDQWITENSPTAKGSGDPEKVWNVPMPSHFDYLGNNNVDMKVYGAMVLNSNHGGKANNQCGERYLYMNKLKDIKGFDDEGNKIKIKGLSESTLKRHIVKLRKVKIGDSDPLITLENTPNGIVYKLNYATTVKDEQGDNTKDRYFIEIPSDIMNELVITSKDGVIKTYILLNVLLKDHPEGKEIQREYIASVIGVEDEGTISKYTTDLVKKGLIYKQERRSTDYDQKKDKVEYKTHTKYKLVDPEDYRKYNKAIKKGISPLEAVKQAHPDLWD